MFEKRYLEFQNCLIIRFFRNTLGYNLYIVGHVQQALFFHNIHHFSLYPETVNIGNIWSKISELLKLFGILCLIGDTLGYNLYNVGYLQQAPFPTISIILYFHHIDLLHFLLSFQFSKELPKYRSNCSTPECVKHNFKGMK